MAVTQALFLHRFGSAAASSHHSARQESRGSSSREPDARAWSARPRACGLLLLPDARAGGVSLGHALLVSIRKHGKIVDRPNFVGLPAEFFLVAVVQRDRFVRAPLLDVLLGVLLAALDDLLDVLVVVAAGLAQP